VARKGRQVVSHQSLLLLFFFFFISLNIFFYGGVVLKDLLRDREHRGLQIDVDVSRATPAAASSAASAVSAVSSRPPATPATSRSLFGNVAFDDEDFENESLSSSGGEEENFAEMELSSSEDEEEAGRIATRSRTQLLPDTPAPEMDELTESEEEDFEQEVLRVSNSQNAKTKYFPIGTDR